MHLAILFNPNAVIAAGMGELVQRLPGGSPCRLYPLTEPLHLAEAIARALDEGVDRLVVAGGDGTVNQVVAALAPDFPAVEVAILPLGTGNDFARSLGIEKDVEQAVEAVLGGEAVAVDVVRMTTPERESWLVNVANGGFGGRVASDLSNQDKGRWGPLAYWMSSISALTQVVAYEVELTVDGERHEVTASGLAVANGRFVGGGFPVAPTARLDDGLIDVTVVDVLPTFDLMAVGVDFALGRDQQHDRVHTYRGGEIRIHSNPSLPFSVDGEPTQTFDATFEAVRGALHVVHGPNPPAIGSRGERATGWRYDVDWPSADVASADVGRGTPEGELATEADLEREARKASARSE